LPTFDINLCDISQHIIKCPAEQPVLPSDQAHVDPCRACVASDWFCAAASSVALIC